MSLVSKIILIVAISGAVVYWYAYSHGMTVSAKTNEMPSTSPGSTNKPGTPVSPPPVPVAVARVEQAPVKIYLEGLGTIQAFQSVTVRSQIDGIIEKINFIEGQDVRAGQSLAVVDSRTYQAQLNQALAKKAQDEAKTAQDRAKVLQDQAHKVQDEAIEKQSATKKVQNEALGRQAIAKHAQDETNLKNARVNLKRFEESRKENAVSDQIVTDQRSLVSQLESQLQADDAATQAIAAAVQGDEVAIQAAHALVQADAAAIQADEAAVKGDEAAVLVDDAIIQYAKTFVSYSAINSPIDGRTGVRLVDAGNLVRTNDANGIVVVTQLQPISVIFTLPQQNLQAINACRATAKLAVLAVDSDKNEIDKGELLLVDNQIDTTTGTIKLKATLPNAKFQLWPGGFVNTRLLLETRENALLVAAPAVQQGPNGTYVFLIKPDSTVEMRSVKVALVQDGKAILERGLTQDDEVVLSGHDRLKNGSKVAVDRNKGDKTKTDALKTDAPAGPGAAK